MSKEPAHRNKEWIGGRAEGHAPAARSRSAPTPRLLALQRTVGNAAVNNLLASGPESTDARPKHDGGSTSIQRDASASGSWDAPDELGAITDRHAARTAITEILLKEATPYQDVDAAGVADQARIMVQKLNEQIASLDGDGAISADEATKLNALGQLYIGFRNNARNALLSVLRSGLDGLADPPDLDYINSAIGEAAHELFMRPDEDKLEATAKVAEDVKDIGEKAKWVADQASNIVKDLETALKFAEISEAIEKFTEPLEQLLKIKEIGTDLLTVVGGLDGKAGETILGSGAQLEAGMDLAGTIAKPLMNAIPLFGDYWNKYLVPVTKACVAGLSKLESIADQINREALDNMINWEPVPNGWRPIGPAPQLPNTLYLTITGGRPVFEYLYGVMQGSAPPMGDDVEKVLLAHKESLETLAGSEMELDERTLNPLTWFRRKPKDLSAWVATNIRTVWMAFYGGGRLRY